MWRRTRRWRWVLVVCLCLTGCAGGTIDPPPRVAPTLATPSQTTPLDGLAAPTTPPQATPTAPRMLPSPVTAATPAAATNGQAHGAVVPIGTLTIQRAAHTAALLADGKVLIVGGCTLASCELDEAATTAEVFDPATSTFAPTGALAVQRVGHTATSLPDGRVLIAGGWRKGALNDSVESYDPAIGVFSVVGKLVTARGGHTAVPLGDGHVLFVGGSGASGPLASAEVFDARSGIARPVGDMATPRAGPVAVRLADGRVLVLGGERGRNRVLASAEIFDPITNTFTRIGDMSLVRYKHAAIRLRDGRVLVVGGSDGADFRGRYASAELFDPTTGRFSPTGQMALQRFKLGDTLALLPDATVLVAGGGEYPEVYDPATGHFLPVVGTLGTAWSFATATALADGRVLIVGGYDDRIALTARAWVYTTGR